MPDMPVVENDDTIIKVRIERTIVRDFPFDVIYLVPFARRDVLPKLFPWSLCLPPNKALVDLIANIQVNVTETLPHAGRADTQHWEGKGTCLTRFQITLDQCFVVVPILPLMTTEEAQKKRNKLPGYLVAPRHVKIPAKARSDEAALAESKFAHILTDDAVLFTPKGPFQPVCRKCPRHMLHMMGKCSLGCKHCFDELILKGSVNEQLQDDDAVQDSNP